MTSASAPSSSPRNVHLDSDRISRTIEQLSKRIDERFPGSGLSQVCTELYTISLAAEVDLAAVSKPNWFLRAAVAVFVAILVLGLILSITRLGLEVGNITWIDLIQGFESATNEIILIGAALLFLVSIEGRVKRNRVIHDINRLRSIAHVIDIHQLTKDPTVIIAGASKTASSPVREMSVFELGRYLDYCSEMLSLTGKVGFLYSQSFPDPQTVTAVNDLEELTTGLSRKIWQKIMLLEDIAANLEHARETPMIFLED
ncbi:MAG: hypothetical protein KDI03_08740 [Anaerolineae bacterium]|nr:hypothetical protein [Anaerolineae bacterium]MCB0200145.1 hypothetical protein [Anaerolineae bacterium]MCB0206109.1 hypothetical protein [Anaerolineae bacterium]MCB0256682.1 hypothetical protein [Anaerolineae bacterium]